MTEADKNRGSGTMRAMTIIAVMLAGTSVQAETYRWIEAERPILTNFGQNPFSPANAGERSILSGGAWIGASGPRKAPLFAVYDVDVPEAGEFRLYARKFWKHGPYRVSLNDGPWLDVGSDIALLDSAELRQNIVANWTSAGTVTLKAGRNRFRIESTTNDGAIAFDCFLLTNGSFAARGLAKPDERLQSSEPGWFAWDPPADAVGSPIDLRSLNEAQAGDGGRVITRDGRFVHEKTGRPVRFWGVNCGPDIMRLDPRDLEQLAAMLASRGVNLVRLHGPIFIQEGKDAGAVDAPQLARTLAAVQIFKRHGIYSTLSIYFPTWLKLDASNGWPDYRGQTPYALLFFDAKFQAMYRSWWHALLTTPEAATGMRLQDEPAILSLEMQNEDSLFFWTFQPRKTIPTSTSELIEKHFGDWLTSKYGSLDAAVARWTEKKRDGDDFANGRVGVMEAGGLEPSRKDHRAKDTARFLFEIERNFYAATRAYLRDELGVDALISASNWTTASDAYLTPLERAANLAGDFIDRHGYYQGKHDGDRSGHSISKGDTFTNRSALRFDPDKPGGNPSPWNPILDTTYDDLPTMVSEIDWLEPNRFRAEAPLLCAALGVQQDVDALAFFAATGPTWEPTLSKFSSLSPVALGQWPAAAMIYRLGLVDEAPILADVRLNLGDLLDFKGSTGIGARAKFIGRTHVTIGDEPTSQPAVQLSPHIDEHAKTITSLTKQNWLDYGHGVFAINAPKVQALVGFLAALDKPPALDGISIRSSIGYGSIAIVSLDDKPIATAGRLLVQVMSEQKNSGFRTSGDPVRKIEAIGGAPILVREFAGTIEFTDGSRWIAQPLSQSGQQNGSPLPASPTLELQKTTSYYVLTRE